MLLEIIKADINRARMNKESEKVIFLSTILGELTANAKMVDGVKTIPEPEIMNLIMKFNKGIDELLSLRPDNEKALREKEIISKYIPKALSEAEIRSFISNRISLGERNMSAIMNAFKSNHSGQYDGKVVSSIVKEMLG